MPLAKRVGVYVFSVISLIAIAAIFLPGQANEPLFRQEMSAVKSITTIHTAETQYLAQYGHYTSSLAQLGPGPTNANLIDGDLATGEKGGFKFDFRNTKEGYNIAVTPSQFGLSGRHTYYSDHNMTIHQHNGKEPATSNDPLLADPVPHRPQG